MAKASITLEDDADGKLQVTVDFDPPLEKGKKPDTPAQIMAAIALKHMTEVSSGK